MTTKKSVIIEMPLDEVELLLKETLTSDELAALSVKVEPGNADPISPERQGEVETARVIVEFVAMAVAGGITYDIIKKVTLAAVAKFGRKKVK